MATNGTRPWNHYRNQARRIAGDAHKAMESLLAEAREDARFPADHTDEFGDPANSAVARAEKAASLAFSQLSEAAHQLTLRMSAEEAADVQDHS